VTRDYQSHFTLEGEAYPYALLRVYRGYHPFARIYNVRVNGVMRWLTGNQVGILKYFDSSHNRHKQLTLNKIATAVRCSRATVSRFLRRLAQWGAFDYLSRMGRGGWVIVSTRKDKSADGALWEAGAQRTREAMTRMRGIMVRKRDQYKELATMRDKMETVWYARIKRLQRLRPIPPEVFESQPLPGMGGIMDATFTRLTGISEVDYRQPTKRQLRSAH